MTNEFVTCTLPRIMIAAPSGRSGKTVVTMGILRALKSAGVDVQPFKKGPDYIDSGWHFLASGRHSRNLDNQFMNEDTMRAVLCGASEGADMALLEAAMGFYDGSDLQGSSSSASIAKATATPVILVVDAVKMTRTVAAIVMGCMHFDPEVNIAGVIVNHTNGARHERRIKEAVEHFCGIPVVGMIPRDERLTIPDRHLGLVTSAEMSPEEDFLDTVAAIVGDCLDLEAIRTIAKSAPDITYKPYVYPKGPSETSNWKPVRIAVVRDRSFNFYYPENLKALEEAGAQLVFVDAINDDSLPEDIDGLYIGGGFPEVLAGELQANESFKASVKRVIDDGIACAAECGGLMYLGNTIIVDDNTYNMVGIFDIDIELTNSRQAHGYSVVSVCPEHPWLDEGTTIVGHEHHHSRVVNASSDFTFGYKLTRGKGTFDGRDGLCYKRTVAGYLHVNAIASPQWAVGLVQAAADYRSSRQH